MQIVKYQPEPNNPRLRANKSLKFGLKKGMNRALLIIYLKENKVY